MRSETESSYIIIIQFGGSEKVIERLQESGPLIKQVLDSYAIGSAKLGFSSEGSDTFGYFIKSKSNAGVLRSALDGKTQRTNISPLRNEDSVLIMELGSEFDARGFSNTWGWLQRQ